MKFSLGEYSAMGSFDSPAKKHYLLVLLQSCDRDVENVFLNDAGFRRQVVAEPEKIEHIDFIATVKSLGTSTEPIYPAPPAINIFMNSYLPTMV